MDTFRVEAGALELAVEQAEARVRCGVAVKLKAVAVETPSQCRIGAERSDMAAILRRPTRKANMTKT
jgi:hypothetical protein